MDGYTPDEWNDVVEAPILVNAGVAAADFSIASFVAEIKATHDAIKSAKQEFADSAVIQQLVTTYETRSKEDYPEQEHSELSEEDLIGQIVETRALVRDKSGDQEVGFFTDFLLTMAKRSAEASGEEFLGTGETVSEKEHVFLKKLRAALTD